MRMAISDTYKRRLPQDGAVPSDTYKGVLVEWGGSAEIRVDSKFIAEVEAKAGALAPRIKQTLDW